MNTRSAILATLAGLTLSACQTTSNGQSTGQLSEQSEARGGTPTVSVAARSDKDTSNSLRPNISVSGQGESSVAGVRPDHIANTHYRRGRAGDTGAQYQLANLYIHGLQGVPQNARLGQEWLKRAAASGHAGALYDLGFAELENNPQTAVDYFRRSGLQGNTDAQSTLGAMFSSGMKVAENPAAAFAWYSLAKDQANAKAVAARLNPAQKNVANNLLQNYRGQVRVNQANAARRAAAVAP